MMNVVMKICLSMRQRIPATIGQVRAFMFVRMVMLVVVTSMMAVPAYAEREIGLRYVVNTNGDIALIGNAILTCPPGSTSTTSPNPSCENTLNGSNTSAGARNDGFTMQYIDIDSDASTFTSSSANLSLPFGSTVLFAGVYWSGISADAARNQILFKTPTSFGYSVLTASVLDTSPFRTNSYQGFANVTAQVQAAGNGTFTVANVQTTPGVGNYGAWGLVVVYQNNSMSLRNLAVYDGFQQLAGTSATIPVGGFLTPLSGPVLTRLGALTYEGDLPATGDTFAINGTQLTDANNQVNNFYNATISDLGVHNTARNPASINNTVFDIDRINVPSGVVGNGSTSATIQVSSPASTETFLLGVVSFSTELYVPIITPNVVKTGTDVNGGSLLAGDVFRWRVALSNTGLDTGTNVVLTDNIPVNMTYVPGSLRVISGANAGVKTDASADDQAEYISSGTPRVVFRLGTGANGSSGGSIAYNESTIIEFDTTVNSGLAAGTVLSNAVNLSYSGQTIGDVYTATSAAATAVVLAPPTIAKSFAPNVINVGASSVLTIVVGNAAGNPGALTGVSFSDTYPAGLVNAASPNAQITCTPGSTPGTLTGGVAGGNTIGLSPGATIAPNGSCTVTVNVTSATTGNYANTTSAVTSTNGGSSPGTASATLSVGKPSITKAFSPTSIVAAASSTITFMLSNPTAVALTNVAFSDTLTNMTVASPNGLGGTCTGTRTAVAGSGSISLTGGSLAANGSCTMTVNVTSSTGGVHPNTTTGVSSTQTGAAGNPSNTALLTVIASPVLTKSFSPTSVQVNVPSQMTLTVTNPNTTTTVTGVAFSDTYPANLRNNTPANLTLNCTSGSTGSTTGGANNGTTVGFTGGTLAPGGSCTITVNVEGTTTGNKVNTTGTVTTTNAGTGAAASSTLNITSLNVPTVTKAFGATTIPVNGTTTMTITLGANNATAINGVSFTDMFPPGLVVAPIPALNNTCGGTVTGATAGSSTLALSGGTINASSTCLVRVTVTSADTAEYINSTGTVTTTNAGTFGPASATLNVLAPPIIVKVFNPDAIAAGGVNSGNKTVLIITLSNPTTATVGLTGVGVTDNFSATNIRVHNNGVISNTCTSSTLTDLGGNSVGGGDNGLILSGATLAPNATCAITVRVHSATAGTYTNTTQAVTSSNGGTGTTASAVLTVGRPDILKSFSVSPIAVGGTSVLTLTLRNPTNAAMTGAAVTDTYPAGMTNTASPGVTQSGCGSPTITAAPNGASIAISGATIPARPGGGGTFGLCTVTVNVTSTLAGTNTIPAGGLTSSGGSNGAAASAQLAVYLRPLVSKLFTPDIILPGATSRLTITLTNNNSVDATGVSFTDNYPSGLVNTASPGITGSCDVLPTGAANGTSFTLSGATILANSSCEVGINVTSNTAGSYLNNSGLVNTANIGSGIASEDTLVVMAPPVAAKAFSPASVLVNQVSVMTITLTNSNSVAITGAAFTDTYPAGLVNDATPNVTTSCGSGTPSATAGGTTVALSGGSIPAGSSCTVSVRVRSASAGSYNNSTGTVTTTNAGTGAAANATLTVSNPMPALGLLKLSAVISDPVNNAVFPKSIPGAIVAYTLRVTNTGPGTVDNNTLDVTDPLPADVDLYVGDLGGPGGGGPVFFVNGSPTSGLTWTYGGLGNTTDDLEFFSVGNGWNHVPVPDGNGFDPLVRSIRMRPNGVMNAAGGGNPYAEFIFRVKIR